MPKYIWDEFSREWIPANEAAARNRKHRENTHLLSMQIARREFELDKKPATELQILELTP